MIRVAGIEKNSIVDGEGFRYAIFTQGCYHNCPGCHNPESHSFDGGTLVDYREILKDLKEDILLDGITLSGGDPLFQAKELIELTKEAVKLGLTVWLYTGFRFEEALDVINNRPSRMNKDMIELLKLVDVIVDGEYIQEKRTLSMPFRGSTNQRVIYCKKSLEENKIIEKETFE